MLVTILGAGASRGSGRFSQRPAIGQNVNVPPLTVDLFDENQYGRILREYDLAHQAGRYIERTRASDSALGLETVLHQLSTSEYAHHRHMALAVPPYLQHLLLATSENLYSQARHYDQLIERLLRIPYVCFVSLNYDVMLDRRLGAHHQLHTVEDYISDDKNWALIKPHGSVNWYHEAAPFRPQAPPIDLEWDRDSFQILPPDWTLSALRGQDALGRGTTDRYPALAAPEGPDDRLVLPASHHEFFFDRLHYTHEIDILVIGYSGLDKEILGLIKTAGPKVRHMTVVSSGLHEAETVVERFREAGIEPVWHEPVPGDFATWAAEEGLDRLVSEWDGPYPRAR